MTILPRIEEASGESLQPLSGLSGHSAYCGVCWEPVFRFWIVPEAPDYTTCPVGDYTAQTCPNATGPARMKAEISRLKAAGLWTDTTPVKEQSQ